MSEVHFTKRLARVGRIAGSAAAVALSALLAAPASAQPVMKIASATINDGQQEWQKLFAAEFTKRIGGKVKVEYYPASQLGSIPRMAEGVLLGTIEAFITPTSFMVTSDPKLVVFDAPGLIVSPQHSDAIFANKAYRDHVETMSLDRGLRIIGTFYAAGQSLLTRKPVKSLAELKGLKIRTFATPLQIEPMKSLGALPIPMALSEVMAQLQNGGIDGMLGGMTVFVPFKFYDAAKHVMQFNFAPVISIVAVNEKWYQSLPKDVQQAMSESGRIAERQLLAWGLENFDRLDKAWVANKGELGKFDAAEYNQMIASFRTIGTKIIGDNPVAKGELAKLEAVADATRPK